MKILLLGKDGQVGRQLEYSLASIGQVQAVGRESLDLAHLDRIRPFIEVSRPDIIVNAAAYTNVEQAEGEAELVFRVNCDAVGILATVASEIGSTFVHYSTDYVFDGELERPYREDDPTGPLNVYGRSKLAGEERILSSGASAIIFRASWIYGRHGKNFPKAILTQAQKKKKLTVVTDSIGAPTEASLIASVTVKALMLKRMGVIPKGVNIYHVAPGGATSWFDFARFIIRCAREHGMDLALTDSDVIPIVQEDLKSKAKRPRNSRLETAKLRNELNIDLPEWEVDVVRLVKSMGSGELNDL